MKQTKNIVLWMMAVAAASSALAAGPRYSISTQQVAAAIRSTGVVVAPEQVALLANVVASTPAPHLVVRSMQRLGNEKMMARIECEDSEQCLAFFVNLKIDAAAAGQFVPSIVSSPAINPATSSRNIVIRGGTPATLMLEGERIHIRIPVICLENGTKGQMIRATDRDRKRVFRAQVVDGGLLQGRL